MDLSAYSIADLESMAAAALSGDTTKIKAVVKTHTENTREARQVFLAYGDRPVGWNRNGSA